LQQVGRLILLVSLCLPLGGCFYSRTVTQVRFNLGEERCFQPPFGGLMTYVLVQERREPWGPWRFPDGGTPFDVAAYVLIFREGREGSQQVGRIDLELYRRGDFGNLEHRVFRCEEPNQIRYRVENGYGADRKVKEGELSIPPET
jgi:hypothetical protein